MTGEQPRLGAWLRSTAVIAAVPGAALLLLMATEVLPLAPGLAALVATLGAAATIARVWLGNLARLAARIRAAAAMAAGSSSRSGALSPLSRDQKAANASWPTEITGTPRVSSTSSVLGRSRIAFAPAETTVTAVCASSCRSAEMSKVDSAPRCTPPMPPVAKTAMPAARAAIIVAATVVDPVPPVARQTARSARESLATLLACASASSCSGSSPTCSRPSSTAMVAGVAPASRTAPSTSRAVSRLAGNGMPWVMMVLSSATMGRPAARAAATSAP